MALCVVDIAGTVLTEQEKLLLASPYIGGVILFQRNYANKAQLRALTRDISVIVRPFPLFIAVDQEGGRVQRFLQDFTPLPSLQALGILYDKDPTLGLQRSFETAVCLAKELAECGVHISFAPVLDLDHPKNPVIHSRSFHANPEHVVALASAFIDGLMTENFLAVGKHFPGHGGVADDSHVTLPSDQRDLPSLEESDLLVFIRLIQAKKLSAVMTGHLCFPAIDAMPVTYSKFWLRTLLREKYQFDGLIFSDDLLMAGGAIYSSIKERVYRAMHAGCDYLLLCNAAEMLFELPQWDDLPFAKPKKHEFFC